MNYSLELSINEKNDSYKSQKRSKSINTQNIVTNISDRKKNFQILRSYNTNDIQKRIVNTVSSPNKRQRMLKQPTTNTTVRISNDKNNLRDISQTSNSNTNYNIVSTRQDSFLNREDIGIIEKLPLPSYLDRLLYIFSLLEDSAWCLMYRENNSFLSLQKIQQNILRQNQVHLHLRDLEAILYFYPESYEIKVQGRPACVLSSGTATTTAAAATTTTTAATATTATTTTTSTSSTKLDRQKHLLQQKRNTPQNTTIKTNTNANVNIAQNTANIRIRIDIQHLMLKDSNRTITVTKHQTIFKKQRLSMFYSRLLLFTLLKHEEYLKEQKNISTFNTIEQKDMLHVLQEIQNDTNNSNTYISNTTSDLTTTMSTNLLEHLLNLTIRTIQYILEKTLQYIVSSSIYTWLEETSPNTLWYILRNYIDLPININITNDIVPKQMLKPTITAINNDLQALQQIRTVVSIEYNDTKLPILPSSSTTSSNIMSNYNSIANITNTNDTVTATTAITNSTTTITTPTATVNTTATTSNNNMIDPSYNNILKFYDTPLQSWYYSFDLQIINEKIIPNSNIEQFVRSTRIKSFSKRDILDTKVPSPTISITNSKSETIDDIIPNILFDKQVRQCLLLCYRMQTKKVRWKPDTPTTPTTNNTTNDSNKYRKYQEEKILSPHQAYLRKGVPFEVVLSPPGSRRRPINFQSPPPSSPAGSTNSAKSAIALLPLHQQEEILRNNKQQKHCEKEKLVQQQEILYFLNSLLPIYTTVRSMLLVRHRGTSLNPIYHSINSHGRILGDSLENILMYLISKSTIPQYTKEQYFRSLVYISTIASEFCFVGTFKQSTLFVVRIDMYRDTIILYKLLQRLIHAQTEIITLVVKHNWTIVKLQKHLGWDTNLLMQYEKNSQFLKLSTTATDQLVYDTSDEILNNKETNSTEDTSFELRDVDDDDTNIQTPKIQQRKRPLRHSTGNLSISSRVPSTVLTSPLAINRTSVG